MDWQFTRTDQQIQSELAPRLPARLFDAHAHLYDIAHFTSPPDFLNAGPSTVGVDAWRHGLEPQVGGARLSGGLFFGYPSPNVALVRENVHLVEQVNACPDAYGLLLVTPEMSPSDVEADLRHPRMRGFKPYHCYAGRPDTFNATLDEFVPQWAWELAHERRLIVTLHLVRDRALADTENQRALARVAERYPNAQVVLAHAGRGFHAPNTFAGLDAVADLPNVWFDTSAVCESPPLMAIMKRCGYGRLLWGSDFPVSQMRGRCVTVGDAFSWICPERIDRAESAPPCHPVLVGLESLRAVMEALTLLDAPADACDAVFHGNAVRLLAL